MAGTTEERIQATARAILDAAREDKPSRLSRERLQGEMMEWAMADERLKVEMLRFVDVFPALHSRGEMSRHLHEYFAHQGVAAPRMLRWGISLAGERSPVAPLAGSVIRRQLRGFAQRFIVGRDARDAIPALKALRASGTGFTLDVLGEATVSEAEAHAYQTTYLDLLDGLAATAATWPQSDIVDQAAWGPLSRVNLSLKITSLYSQIDPVDFEGSVAAVKDRLRPIFRKGIETCASLTLDLEQFRYRDLTLAVFTSLLDEDEFRGYDHAGIVLQAYLRDADRDLNVLLAWARARERVFSLRLVKGAYWDYETVIAAQEGWPVPVFTYKPDTDAMYEKLTRLMLQSTDVVRPAFASHNVRSLAVAIETARELGLARDAFEIQMLHGMGDPIKTAVHGMGLRLREYAPVGELIPGMAYLVRRLLENTANDSFLRQTFVEGAAADELVLPPQTSADFGAEPLRLPRVAATDPDDPGAFANQPHADFARRECRGAYLAALETVRTRGVRHYPLRIGGRDVETARVLESADPAAPGDVLGSVAYGGRAEAEAAVAAARAALPGLARHLGQGARRRPLPHRGTDARRRYGAGRARDRRSRQDAPRGRRRRRRSDRLPRVLRARDAASRHAAAHGRRPRRAKRLLLPAARRRAGDRPLELPARDPHRHDQRGARRRLPRNRQAGGPDAAHRRPAGAPPGGGGRACGHRQLPAQPRR